MSSFDDLQSTVDELVKIGLPDGVGKLYKKAISDSHSYVKNHYPYHIQFESKCAAHCAKFALSENLDKNFRSECEHGEHDGHAGYVPLREVCVKRFRVLKHGVHVYHSQHLPL